MNCRYCDSDRTVSVLANDDWREAARTSGDERAQMLEIVQSDPRLDFGDIIRCRDCGFMSVEKVPDGTALDDFYRAYYANRSYGSKEDKKIKRAMRRIRKLCPSGTAGRRFLDVGCNLGFAVEAAGRLGMEAFGIDVDEAALSMAAKRFPSRNFELVPVQDLAARKEVFDIVYCTEVVEHLADFRSFFAALAALAGDNGTVFLTTPDAGHFRRPGRLEDWNEVKPPEHLQWFRKSHIREILDRHGMQTRFRFNWKPGIRALASKTIRDRA